jgi:hypothetical protein
MIIIVDNENNLIENIVLDQPPFEIYIEGYYFIIKIENKFLKYKDHTLDSVFLQYWHGGNIHSIVLN